MAPQTELNRQDAIAAKALLSGLREFSERAGHDLLGPLNQAGSLLALFIRRNGSRRDSDADHLLEFLRSASTRMERITTGVRKYMEIAKWPLGFEPVDLNAALASALGVLEKTISETDAVIVSDRLPIVSADAVHMVTIFEILIGNSITFCNPNAPPRIRVSSLGIGERQGIEVADNGIGIAPEYRESVFLPFKRLSSYPGAGLGLAMAKLIIELHGGTIRVQPAPSGVGTTVQFTVQPE